MTSALPPVLYVEDEENDVLLMEMAFVRAGILHRLAVVTDGQQAMDYLAGTGEFGDRTRHPLPAMVLLDLNLPRLHGLEVLKRVRAQEQFSALPIVVFSSSEQAQDRQRAGELGATAYIVKPSQLERFMDVAATLKRTWLS